MFLRSSKSGSYLKRVSTLPTGPVEEGEMKALGVLSIGMALAVSALGCELEGDWET
jgi:hypothetical protein